MVNHTLAAFSRSALIACAMTACVVSYNVHAESILDASKSILGNSNVNGALPGAGGATGAGLLGSLPMDKILALLKSQGYSNITGLAPTPTGNALQASATNPSGNLVNLLINPKTGSVLSALQKK